MVDFATLINQLTEELKSVVSEEQLTAALNVPSQRHKYSNLKRLKQSLQTPEKALVKAQKDAKQLTEKEPTDKGPRTGAADKASRVDAIRNHIAEISKWRTG